MFVAFMTSDRKTPDLVASWLDAHTSWSQAYLGEIVAVGPSQVPGHECGALA